VKVPGSLLVLGNDPGGEAERVGTDGVSNFGSLFLPAIGGRRGGCRSCEAPRRAPEGLPGTGGGGWWARSTSAWPTPRHPGPRAFRGSG